MDFSPETVRARFNELTTARAKIDADLNPLWDELTKLDAGDTKLTVKAAKEREAEIRSKVRLLQARLSPIEQERAMCARALGGKTASVSAPDI